jgi:hypothetical protein
MTRIALAAAAARLLAGCHAGPPHTPPGHGGVPSGQAKKADDEVDIIFD